MGQEILWVSVAAVAVLCFVVFGRRAKQLAAGMAAAGPQIEAAYRAAPMAGESPPRILCAYSGSGTFRKVLMLGITERRVFVSGGDGSLEVLVLDDARTRVVETSFTDTGTTKVVFTKGWEATIVTGAVTHTWRLHAMTGQPGEADNLAFLLAQLRRRQT